MPAEKRSLSVCCVLSMYGNYTCHALCTCVAFAWNNSYTQHTPDVCLLLKERSACQAGDSGDLSWVKSVSNNPTRLQKL